MKRREKGRRREMERQMEKRVWDVERWRGEMDGGRWRRERGMEREDKEGDGDLSSSIPDASLVVVRSTKK